MENDWKHRLGVVYSTKPDFQYRSEEDEEPETLVPPDQKLYVSLDRKHRKGKVVTLVEGFIGAGNHLKSLEKELKSSCGTGGTVKDGVILIQGDFRDRVCQALEQKGYVVKRKGG
jgi:translation initiation factor 1